MYRCAAILILALACAGCGHVIHGELDRLHPRHVLVTHYESFSRGPEKSLRFVTLLTNGGANRFLGRVRTSVSAHDARGPTAGVCGPSSRVSTVPLPGEWIRFQASPR